MPYRMIGKDLNSNPSQHRVWVDSSPDLTGLSYSGVKSGDLPLFDITVYNIPDGAVANFTLPNAFYWNPTKKLLPNLTYRSQSAIIEGFIYLFGGENSNKILKASVENPCDFVDTGSTLPMAIGGSQLAVIDGYIYLFGGWTTKATSVILRANVSDPLTWVVLGSTLPGPLCDSQLLTLNDKIYLFGGLDKKSKNVIYVANRGAPHIWSTSMNTLPINVAGSAVTISDQYIYLFGGYNEIALKSILRADISSPEVWSVISAELPKAMYYNHFFQVGDQKLLFGTTQKSPVETKETSIFYTKNIFQSIWTEWIYTIPGYLHQSELICVYDRLFFLGGNGNTAIFASDYFASIDIDSSTTIQYGDKTRIQVENTLDSFDLFSVLGVAPWTTDF